MLARTTPMVRWLLGSVLTLLFGFAVVRGAAVLQIWRYMQPYRAMEHERAADVLRQIGTSPWHRVTSDGDTLRHLLHVFPLSGEAGRWRGGEVWVYAADPFGDGEGAVVYLFFDAQDRLVAEELAFSR